jgi:hypothetical protein
MSPNAGEGGSEPMSPAVYTGAKLNFGDLVPYFIFVFALQILFFLPGLTTNHEELEDRISTHTSLLQAKFCNRKKMREYLFFYDNSVICRQGFFCYKFLTCPHSSPIVIVVLYFLKKPKFDLLSIGDTLLPAAIFMVFYYVIFC